MVKIMPIGKEIYMQYNTPQNGAYMDFSFKKLLKLSWVKFTFYSTFSVTWYMEFILIYSFCRYECLKVQVTL